MINKKTVISLLITLVLVFSLVGCETTPKDNSQEQTDVKATEAPAEATEAPAEEEEPAAEFKDTITVALDSDPVALDPTLVSDGNSATVIKAVMEGLMGFEQGTGELIPVLAESYKFSDDGKEVVFNLRSGVKFHDGTDFNADAAIFNVNRQLPENKTEEMPNAGTIYGNVEKVEKVDDLTIKFTLVNPDVTFLTALALNPGCEMVSPTAFEADPEAFKKSPVGTGSYKFVEWKAAQYVKLERNEEYWGEKAKTANVIYKVIPESAVRASELLAGTVDVLNFIDINSIDQLKSSGMNIYSTPGATISYIAFYTDKEPFNNKLVRQAIFMGIDREAIVKGLYGENAVVSNGIIPPTTLGYSDELKALPYDPEKAKELLAEAGYEDGLKFQMLAYNVVKNYNPAAENLAIAIQNELKKIGVEVDVVVKPWNEFVNNLFEEEHEGDAIQIGWGSTTNDPADFTLLLDSSNCGTGLNFADYENTELDELMAKAKTVGDIKEREAIYIEIQKIINDEVPWLFMSHSKDYSATSPKVTGYAVGFGGQRVDTLQVEK